MCSFFLEIILSLYDLNLYYSRAELLNFPLFFNFFFLENGVSKLDGNIIVQKHNDFRKLIATGRVLGQPRGINLKKLVRYE